MFDLSFWRQNHCINFAMYYCPFKCWYDIVGLYRILLLFKYRVSVLYIYFIGITELILGIMFFAIVESIDIAVPFWNKVVIFITEIDN